jgi:hypothetical protein
MPFPASSTLAYLPAWRCGDVVRHVPEMPDDPDAGAGLRAANARLRELLAERDAQIGLLREQLAVLQSQVEALGAQVKTSSHNSSKLQQASFL